MFLYIWARKNPHFVVSFFDVFHFRSCFLPFFMILITSLLGYDPTMNIIGTTTGHLYFFLEDIVPHVPETQDLRLLKPPRVLKWLCDYLRIHDWNNMNNREGWFADENQVVFQDENGQVVGEDDFR